MNYAILHVGGPKCGSSALQHYLSYNRILSANGGRTYEYLAITESGDLVTGSKLRKKAQASPLHYVASSGISGKFLKNHSFDKSAEKIQELRSTEHVGIFSCEGWGRHASRFRNNKFLIRAGLTAEVVLYVRPPIEWFNSAWWQWGAWTRLSVEEWVKSELDSVQWSTIAQDWASVPNVRRVSVFDVSGGVLEQFTKALGVPLNTSSNQKHNQSSPSALLDFLQRNRKYRKGPHDPKVEFILSRLVRFSGARAPWVINRDLQHLIHERTVESNKQVVDFIPDEFKATFLDNPRWMDVDAYEDMQCGPLTNFSSRKDTDTLISDLIDALLAIYNGQK